MQVHKLSVSIMINLQTEKKEMQGRSKSLAKKLSLSLSFSPSRFLRKHKEKKRRKRSRDDNISALPQECISHILSFTSPRDACVSSLVSHTFKNAADSDDVWDKFFPPQLDSKDIVSRSVEKFLSKKELYSCLHGGPILLDGGNKSLYLEKKTDKVCFMLGSKELTITWDGKIEWIDKNSRTTQFGDTICCWKWISPSHSRFADAIELLDNNWISISGKIETRMLSPKTTYGVYLVFKFTDYADGFDPDPWDFEDAGLYGVGDISVEFVRGQGIASGLMTRRLGILAKPRRRLVQQQYAPHGYERQSPSESEGGWLEVKLGKFYTGEGVTNAEVGMMVKDHGNDEWKSRLWKSGLIIQGIEIKPKSGKI